jgi:hypothetical protein
MGTAGQVANDLPALPVFRERRITGGTLPMSWINHQISAVN